jgi:8-oxo-dGTP diphosphatase
VLAMQAGTFATIVNERGEVLLCHRRDVDLWNAPGGRVEAGESPWEAVVREIREETGVEAEVVRLASVSWKPGRTEILFQFVCRIIAGQLSLSDECDAFAYFPLDNLPEPLGPAFRARLLEWSQNPDETALITDEGPSTRELLERGLLRRDA